MKFDCPHCNQNIEAEDNWAGTQASCPTCKQPILIPKLGLKKYPIAPEEARRQAVLRSFELPKDDASSLMTKKEELKKELAIAIEKAKGFLQTYGPINVIVVIATLVLVNAGSGVIVMPIIWIPLLCWDYAIWRKVKVINKIILELHARLLEVEQRLYQSGLLSQDEASAFENRKQGLRGDHIRRSLGAVIASLIWGVASFAFFDVGNGGRMVMSVIFLALAIFFLCTAVKNAQKADSFK